MNETLQEIKDGARIARISNSASNMLRPDSPKQFIEAAIESAFLIDKMVTERIKNGD